MILLLRTLARLVSFLLLVALALAGFAVAVFSIGGGAGGFSIPGLARLVHLPALRDQVSVLLMSVEAPGPVAAKTAASGAGAMVVGIALIVGAVWPRRERLVTLESSDGGVLAARPRPLTRAADALADQTRGLVAKKVRVRPGRRTGGRIRVRARHAARDDAGELRKSTEAHLAPLAEPFGLRTRTRIRVADERVVR